MSSGKQHNLSILNEQELNNIIYYLKNNIHVNYYVIYKLSDINKCWFLYFQHPSSIYPISLKFNNVNTLFYRGPSKKLIQFIKINGKEINEYGKANNLNLKTSLKRELTENEFIEPDDIIIKTRNYINEINKKKKTKKDIINVKLETPETDIELSDNELNVNNIKLDPFKEYKKNQNVRINLINRNDINIEYWKENIHTDYKEIQVLWIWGASDVDKTDKIKRIIKDNKEKYGSLINVVSFDGKYWKGIGEKAKIAIYDGFKENHMSCFEFLDFVDKEIHELPTLSGNVKNNYNLIIISSIFNPEYIYVNYNEDIKDQIKQSINKIIKI